ncbi:MAG: penicillin-binding protein 2 [Deltaproteobacteria bacterium]|nr:penicillin-binding protein 2 [Deltaproteobacteria bacterium]MBW2344548.1 penicillin-binding protein 2 [Deltaproteobacteria bacterium]
MRTSDFDPVSVEIFNKQLKRAILVVLVVFGLLILRLWYLQILSGSAYRAKSEDNRFQLHDILPFRGIIFDRKGEMLVGNRPSYGLYVIPEGIQDREQLLKSLNRLIGLDPKLAMQKLKHASPAYPFRPVCLKRDMSRDELAVIETQRFNLSGVMIKVKPQRHYAWGKLASHVLGYLGEISESQLKTGKFPGNKQGDLIGKSGVEWKWQPLLNGMRGGEQVEVDAAGRKIRVISRKPPVSGASIYLTIDKDLQALVERALDGKKGAIVAMNPNNGEILAMASTPSFNPNVFIRGIDMATWKGISTSKDFPLQNRALCGQYPPGSVFKIIVALAGLEEGVIDPEEELVCNGVYTLGRHKYHCWKKHGHGKVKLHRALRESCDIYFYKIGKRLGVDRIARYAKRFGFGKTTGFDAGREKIGLIPTSQWKLKRFGVPWQTGETISTAIGQSFVLVTPIQMATMISTVFNGGDVYRPQVTRRVEKINGEKLFEFAPELIGKAGIKHEYLELVKNGLIAAVNEPHGTGWRTKLKDVTVAGKTGTAQVVALDKGKVLNQGGEVPLEFRDHAWFVGIAPAERPEIALAIVIEHGGHGGSAAAPIAKKMITAYLGVEK